MRYRSAHVDLFDEVKPIANEKIMILLQQLIHPRDVIMETIDRIYRFRMTATSVATRRFETEATFGFRQRALAREIIRETTSFAREQVNRSKSRTCRHRNSSFIR